MDELALDEEGAGADDARRGVQDAEEEVLVVVVRDPFVALVPLLRGESRLACVILGIGIGERRLNIGLLGRL